MQALSGSTNILLLASRSVEGMCPKQRAVCIHRRAYTRNKFLVEPLARGVLITGFHVVFPEGPSERKQFVTARMTPRKDELRSGEKKYAALLRLRDVHKRPLS